MELRAGEGGEDARLFTRDLLRMYERYSRKAGWSFVLLEARRAGDGVRLAVFEVRGAGADRLHGEAGAHSIQHVTRSRGDGRIHTSNASVVVFDLAEVDRQAGVLVHKGDIRLDRFRGSGAGGQHRNVTDSAIRATHIPSGEMATVTSGRSQTANREQALAVLMARLQQRESAAQLRGVAQRRAHQARAGRAQSTRVYDCVRDVVRCARTGQKVGRVKAVLNGDLDRLLRP